MTVNYNLITDKAIKIFLLALISMPFFIYSNMIHNGLLFIKSMSFVNESYSHYSVYLYPFMIISSFIFFVFFTTYLSKSNYNTIRLEFLISRFFSKTIVLIRSDFLYHFIIVVFYAFIVHSVLETLVVIINYIVEIDGINHISIVKNQHFGFDIINMQKIITIGSLLMMTILLVRPQKINLNFLFGFLLLPISLSLLDIDRLNKLYQVFGEFPTGILDKFKYFSIDNTEQFATGFLTIFFALFVYQAIKNKDNIYRVLSLFIIGFLSSFIAKIVVLFLVSNGAAVDQFKNNPNIMDVKVHGKTFTIDQTYSSIMDCKMPVMDCKRTEWLIESYVGLGMLNARSSLEYILSPMYKGDKEKAIKLSSDALLTNLRAIKNTLDKRIHFLKNENITSSTRIKMLIPLLIYEESPLNHQERSLLSILVGDYQKGVEYFIEDAVNNKIPRILRLKSTDGTETVKTNSFGDPVLQAIIKSLIRNNLAYINYNKVEPDHREKLKALMEESSVIFLSLPSDETVEEWYKIFRVDRFISN